VVAPPGREHEERTVDLYDTPAGGPPRTHPGARTVVIVGAGFCGTVVAINLLRRARAEPLRVVLIDRTQPARGVAYARRPFPYLLNVPAGRMSARASEPLEFLNFARQRLPGVSADDFLPRELYGQYLEATLARAEQCSLPHSALQLLTGTAIAVERRHRSGTLCVHLADGRTIGAEAVVLALGNPPPAPLPGAEHLHGSAGYVADPWAPAAPTRPGDSLLLVGTGLTMADVLLAAQRQAGGRLSVHALSRRGLIPPPQTRFVPIHDEGAGAVLWRTAAASTRSLYRAVRNRCAEIEAAGGDWREAISSVREPAPEPWQRLSVRERRRFLRHVRPYWDIHRHRLPESTAAQLHTLRRAGTLQLHAGRLLALDPVGRRIRATWRPRGTASAQTLLIDKVINCTGPDYDARRTDERLLRSLMAQGMASADPAGLGLVTDACGALGGSGGRTTRGIYYIGPMLRAAYWETTAVAELREHAARLAAHLCAASEPWRARGTTPALAAGAYMR
jgi:uncharacterized NAD(P)/FAD-binding protein YdhS